MVYAEYQLMLRERRSMLRGRSVNIDPAQALAMKVFEDMQPEVCPVCGAGVFDPFLGELVVHDVANCKGVSYGKSLAGD